MTNPREFLELGICVIPVKEDKKPMLLHWKEFQTRLPTEEEFLSWPVSQRYACVTGAVSGNIECVDVDAKYGISTEAVLIACQHIPKLVQRTPSGGVHMVYRIKDGPVGRNQKVAMRPATEQEMAEDEATPGKKKSQQRVLIETRGEGGYFLVAPSVGYVLECEDFENIPSISKEERDDLLSLCAYFDQMPDSFSPPAPAIGGSVAAYDGEKAGDAYNRQVDCLELLRSYGWREVGRGKGYVKVLRPGTTTSATSGSVFTEKNRAYIFSTSTCLPIEKALSPFAIYAYHEHAGDFSAAAKALGAKGYGDAKRIPSPPKSTPPPPPTIPGIPTSAQSPVAPGGHNDTMPFRFLGFMKSDGVPLYCFYSRAANLVVKMSPAAMTEANLLTIAPLVYWESNYPKRNGGVNLVEARSWLIETSNMVGIYNPNKIRGRGVWDDNGRVVVHRGGELSVDNFPVPLSGLRESKFIYEIGSPLQIGVGEPLPVSESRKLMDLMRMLCWENPLSAELVAGWTLLAPLCGMLPWRPHLWLTGPAGAGKSWVQNKIIRALLGEMVFAVQGNTSEAGIRQHLNGDAIPVVFDEGEGNGERRAEERIQAIIELVRSASTNDGGSIVKGGADGRSQEYVLAVVFCFASIVPQAVKKADLSRISQIGLRVNTSPNRAAEFAEIKRLRALLLTDPWCKAFHARTIALAPSVMANVNVFREATSIVLGEQRAGDQIGTLLGGAYACCNDTVATLDEAIEYVAARKESLSFTGTAKNDEEAIVDYIVEKIIRVDSGKGGAVNRTVGELIQIVASGSPDGVEVKEAERALKHNGMKVKDGCFWVSSSAVAMKELLKGTPWGAAHATVLSRVPGAAEKSNDRFGSVSTRSIGIPLQRVLPGINEGLFA